MTKVSFRLVAIELAMRLNPKNYQELIEAATAINEWLEQAAITEDDLEDEATVIFEPDFVPQKGH